MVGQRLVAVEERPAGRTDLVVITLRRAVHAELRRAVAEMGACPVAQTALHGLEYAAPGGTARLPGAGEGALGSQRLVLVVGIIRLYPRTGQADLEIGQWLIHQRPDRGIKAHARVVGGIGRVRLVPETDVAVQALAMGGDAAGGGLRCGWRLAVLGGAGQGEERHPEGDEEACFHLGQFRVRVLELQKLM